MRGPRSGGHPDCCQDMKVRIRAKPTVMESCWSPRFWESPFSKPLFNRLTCSLGTAHVSSLSIGSLSDKFESEMLICNLVWVASRPRARLSQNY
jgi:hypothetical protein